jgi:membrane peptidoglycan carboxypeptidase
VLGASEVNLLELANLYRAIASGLVAEPYIVDRATDASGREVYRRTPDVRPVSLPPGTLEAMQEGLRSVVRLPSGTAHALDSARFPIPVMGKTGTTSDFRDALFVGSTYGTRGITIAVRVGFDDNRELGAKETGGRAALPIFRDVMLRVYREGILGTAPPFPRYMEDGIDRYLRGPSEVDEAALEAAGEQPVQPEVISVALHPSGVAPQPSAQATFYTPSPSNREQ